MAGGCCATAEFALCSSKPPSASQAASQEAPLTSAFGYVQLFNRLALVALIRSVWLVLSSGQVFASPHVAPPLFPDAGTRSVLSHLFHFSTLCLQAACSRQLLYQRQVKPATTSCSRVVTLTPSFLCRERERKWKWKRERKRKRRPVSPFADRCTGSRTVCREWQGPQQQRWCRFERFILRRCAFFRSISCWRKAEGSAWLC